MLFYLLRFCEKYNRDKSKILLPSHIRNEKSIFMLIFKGGYQGPFGDRSESISEFYEGWYQGPFGDSFPSISARKTL